MVLPTPPSRLHRLDIGAAFARTIDVDRGRGHRFVMSLLADDLATTTPRESTSTTWRVEPGNGELVISTCAGITDPRIHTITDLPQLTDGDRVTIAVDLEAVHRRAVHIEPEVYAEIRAAGIPIRVPRSAVPREEVAMWAEKLLATRGFRVEVLDHLELPSRSWRPQRRGGALNVARLRAPATVVDAAAAADALARGVGRGLSFGCGLIRVGA